MCVSIHNYTHRCLCPTSVPFTTVGAYEVSVLASTSVYMVPRMILTCTRRKHAHLHYIYIYMYIYVYIYTCSIHVYIYIYAQTQRHVQFEVPGRTHISPALCRKKTHTTLSMVRGICELAVFCKLAAMVALILSICCHTWTLCKGSFNRRDSA